MNQLYYCPECKSELKFSEKNLMCENCKLNFLYENGICVFPTSLDEKNMNDQILKDLIHQINIKGYDNAIEIFLKSRPEFKSALTYTKYDQSADIIFHNIGNNNTRCLEINSKLGNKSEILSNIFEHVYSIEFNDQFLELQRTRFDERKCKNISISKCDIFKLPFPKNFFDVILCNGILEKITKFSMNDKEKSESRFVKELKRVINQDGKIIFGIGDKNETKMTIDKETVHQKTNFRKWSHSRFQEFFKNEGLNVKSYWVLPSYEKPYFSGPIEGEIALKWFFANLENFIDKKTLSRKKKLLFGLLKKSNYPFMKKLLEIFSPSFIFCCEKNRSNDTIEDWIKKDTNYENFLMVSRRVKILFVLLNKLGNPEKKVVVKRYGNKFPTKLEYFQRKFPAMKDPEKKYWMEDWFSGRSVNPLDENEVSLAINWLINFQNETKQNKISKNEVATEIEIIKKGLQLVPHGDLTQYYQWLKDYEEFMEKNIIFSTAVHGDFWVTNILYDSKKNEVNILDWELFREKGNPLLDILLFIYDLMAKTSKDPLETFERNLNGCGEANKIIKMVKNTVETHFGFKIDFILLLRYYLMKKMIPKEEEMEEKILKKKTLQSQPTLYMKMLELLSKK